MMVMQLISALALSSEGGNFQQGIPDEEGGVNKLLCHGRRNFPVGTFLQAVGTKQVIGNPWWFHSAYNYETEKQLTDVARKGLIRQVDGQGVFLEGLNSRNRGRS